MRDTTSRNLTGTDMSAPTNAALEQFRTGFYGCLSGWGDALFELHGRDTVHAGSGVLGADVEPGADIPAQPRQPLQVSGPRRDRRRPGCGYC